MGNELITQNEPEEESDDELIREEQPRDGIQTLTELTARLATLSKEDLLFASEALSEAAELNRIGWRWFHKPYSEQLEIPDITSPKDVYVITVNEIESFLHYKGEDIDFDNRYCGYRLVKFNYSINTLVIRCSLKADHLYPPYGPLLLKKLLFHKVETLIFESINIADNYIPLAFDNYPTGKIPITIKNLIFQDCSLESNFLNYWTKRSDADKREYNLTKIGFVNCTNESPGLVDTLTINMRTNYNIRKFIYVDDSAVATVKLFEERKKNRPAEDAMTRKFINFVKEARIKESHFLTELEDYFRRNKDAYAKCEGCVRLILLANRYSKGNVFNILPVDLARQIAKMIWASAGTKIWTYNINLDFLEGDLAEFL